MVGFKQQRFTNNTAASSLGQLGEKIAKTSYLKRGYSVIGENIFNATGKRRGELDLVVLTARKLFLWK